MGSVLLLDDGGGSDKGRGFSISSGIRSSIVSGSVAMSSADDGTTWLAAFQHLDSILQDAR